MGEMTSHEDRPVEAHYARSELGAAILRALAADGKDLERLTVADLAPVDEFHIRGREATLELARIAGVAPGLHVLDVGCGLGGSARHLASEHGCTVTGLDATEAYCDVAEMLSRRVGLGHRTSFRHGSALSMPFADGTFDLAWTEHVQMNIEDKRAFYSEITRVLKPQGRLVFHDVFQGPGGEIHFPVPWAGDRSLSHLITAEAAAETLAELGLRTKEWRDVTAEARDWFSRSVQEARRDGRPQTGLHLLMGETTGHKFENMGRNLDEGRVAVVQAVLARSG
jgi:ubiquinone/menaquinone biosynthesis C-methylase UbiE